MPIPVFPTAQPHHGQAALPRQRLGHRWLHARASQQLSEAAIGGVFGDDAGRLVADAEEVDLWGQE